jgi:hypothetical protein
MKKIKVVWSVTPFRLVHSYRRLEGALHGLLEPADGDANAPPKRRHLKDVTALHPRGLIVIDLTKRWSGSCGSNRFAETKDSLCVSILE